MRFFFLLAILIVPVTGAQASEPEDEFIAFDRFLEEFRKESGTPALSAVIVRDGRIAWEGYYGTYDDEGDLATLPETTYKIASVTKPIAATAILAESASGELHLDTSMASDGGWMEVCEFFVANTPIPFMAGGEDRHGNPVPPMDCRKPTTLSDMLDMRANGDAFVYNPIAFARIDRAILGAGGRDLREIVRHRVATPAGMENTALGWRDPEGGAALRYLAEPFHVVEGRAIKQPLPDDDFRAAAGIIAGPRALAAFDIAFDSGVLIPSAMIRDLVDAEIGPLGDYRAGWFLEDWNGQRLLWHSGWNEKKGSALYLKVPEKRLSLIVLANTEAIWWGNSVVKAEIVESAIALRFLEEFAS
ncbi:serine hydrolase [Erythrobacter sp.]|uniref:serine hydrolase domain-containing protein n=1 Tax=Erythrobacter sp. TaxID=1042 RepID=UPI001AFFC1D6|nr:serine hydrolase domain-containing protein [Erythrobacter sp.]MBO6526855.1 beta-lactamase family protein [Erythrobacter sp.]MBO6528528.1 beta-lactamase family protein [Erythrobacter sp.]